MGDNKIKTLFRSEKEFIRYIRKKFEKKSQNVIRSWGEDCAMIKLKHANSILISCDDFIEGRHFELAYFPLREAGRKALVTNISDIISMGGTPLYYLVSLLIPKDFGKESIPEIYIGFKEIEKKYNMQLIGGNTEVYQGPLSIRITIIGATVGSYGFCRNKAKVGDKIFITNNIGLAAIGLLLFKRGWRKIHNHFITKDGNKENRPLVRKALKEFLLPSIPYDFSIILATYNLANAAIDISDGLVSDLYEICKESKVGAKLFKAQLPVNKSLLSFCKQINVDFYKLAMSGGEDYQLLFTVPESKVKLLSDIAKGHEFYCIGEIIQDSLHRVRLVDGKEEYLLEELGFDHFLH